jgi:hypothetical protein
MAATTHLGILALILLTAECFVGAVALSGLIQRDLDRIVPHRFVEPLNARNVAHLFVFDATTPRAIQRRYMQQGFFMIGAAAGIATLFALGAQPIPAVTFGALGLLSLCTSIRNLVRYCQAGDRS